MCKFCLSAVIYGIVFICLRKCLNNGDFMLFMFFVLKLGHLRKDYFQYREESNSPHDRVDLVRVFC